MFTSKINKYNDVISIIESLFTLLLSKYTTPLVLSSLQTIERQVTEVDRNLEECILNELLESNKDKVSDDDFERLIVEEEVIEEEFQASLSVPCSSKKEPLYKQSPFYRDIQGKKRQLRMK